MKKSACILILLFTVIFTPSYLLAQSPTSYEGENVYTIVEKMPQYMGGTDSLIKYIKETTVYPKDALKDTAEGRVFVGFIITREGWPVDVKILRGRHPLLDEEALRVVKSMPKWQPGTQNGKAVNVAFIVPVDFKLE